MFTGPGRRSPHRSSNQRASLQGAQPSTNILSSILRAPHPGLQTMRPQPTENYNLQQPGRGHSPIRVITCLPSGMSASSPRGGLSPSRIPTTLPPKKSLSPSRVIYTEGRQSVSPQPVRPPSAVSPSGGMAQTRSVQSQLLSHLPYLAQTLQQRDQPHEIFQQYKPQKHEVRQTVTHGKPGGVTMVTIDRTSPGPRPAHQKTPTPPPVSVVRRTPSPAHMPMGIDLAKVIVEHPSRPGQAVNLVKPIPQEHHKV